MSHYTSLQAPGTWVKNYLKVGGQASMHAWCLGAYA